MKKQNVERYVYDATICQEKKEEKEYICVQTQKNSHIYIHTLVYKQNTSGRIIT